jgi:mannose-6-phosphate isomerase-like protein (cupin superfamily)
MSSVKIMKPTGGSNVGSYKILALDRIAQNYSGLDISLVKVMPNSPSKEMHRHDSDEELWLIARGRGLVTYDGGCEVEVGPGDVVYCPRGGEHHIRNVGEEILDVFNIHLSMED